MSTSKRTRGFTLVELIVVITLAGILAVVGSVIIVQPFLATEDMSQRARLVDTADLALQRMARQIRLALPNSVRVDSDGNRTSVEFVRTFTGGRYRRYDDKDTDEDNRIKLEPDSDQFDVLGGLQRDGEVETNTGDCGGANDVTCMNIYNTGDTNYDVYEGDNLAQITSENVPDTPHDQLTFTRANANSEPTFRNHSPNQRFYLFDEVVSFVCDTSAGEQTLTRHWDYGLNAKETTTPGGETARLAEAVVGCDFKYEPGTATRSGLLTLTLELRRDAGEIKLFKQIHILNTP